MLLHTSHWSDICLLLKDNVLLSNIMASIHFSDEVLHSRERSQRLSLRGRELLAEAKSSRLNGDEVHLKHEQTLVPLAGSTCVSGNTQAAGKRRRDGWTSRAASSHSSISFPPTLIPHQDWSLATITPTLIQWMQHTHRRFILDLYTQKVFQDMKSILIDLVILSIHPINIQPVGPFSSEPSISTAHWIFSLFETILCKAQRRL